MPNDPILHLLGLARKAGRLEIGEEPVGAVCRSRQARLVLLASDAAPNTCRRAPALPPPSPRSWPPALRSATAPPPSSSGRRPTGSFSGSGSSGSTRKTSGRARRPWAAPPARKESPPEPAGKRTLPRGRLTVKKKTP